ncbi:hypothetical protein HK101_009846 [Irineochytrium annulatum]|nr:hypothetical protein HK101_009846 [Irineochytrium annulatum]
MNNTLEQNGIRDEGTHMERLGMDEEQYLPAIHLYFRLVNKRLVGGELPLIGRGSDDLTVL